LRRLLAIVALGLLGGALPSCGGGAGGITPRYRAATGSSIRYHTVLRSLPAGSPGRTISAASTVAARTTDAADRYAITVTWSPVHVAGEGGHLVEVQGAAVATFTRDARRRIDGAPRVEGVEAGAALSRTLTEGLVLPAGALTIGQAWELSPIARSLDSGAAVTIPRRARLAEVADGVATIEVRGETEPGPVDVHGVSVQMTASVEQTYRLRVADAVLVEMEGRSRVTLTSPTGRATHRWESHVERVLATMPDPEPHGFEPTEHPSACTSRLRAMGQRFELAPRNLDFDVWATLDVDVPVRPSGQRIDEAGPILVGMDEETLLGAVGGADVEHTVTVYVVAPTDVSDEDLRGWLDELVAPGIEIRRIVQGQVHPPSPEPAAEVVALDRRMHEAHSVDPWRTEVRSLIALCDAAVAAYDEARQAEPADRAAAMRGGLLEAYQRCGCESTDLARLERTLNLRLGGPELGWEPLR